MSSQLDDSTRRLIPRWRYSTSGHVAQETASDRVRTTPLAIDERYWEEKIQEWERSRTLPAAADLVACATVLDRCGNVNEAIECLLKGADQLRPDVVRLAEFAHQRMESSGGERCFDSRSDPGTVVVAASDPTLDARLVVAKSRARLSMDPRDALAWMDMSRAYTTLGQLEPAKRAMQRALQLAPNHRLILRAACRRLIHVNDAPAAHALIARHPRTAGDPWLIAAELAVAQVLERKSVFLVSGTKMLARHDFRPAATTELSAALSMQAYGSGSLKIAKRLMRGSLEDPTDNVVAQARWIGAQLGGIDIPESVWDTPRSFEAWAWRAYLEGDWQTALRFAKEWVADEPFSSRAAVTATFVATSVNRDFEYAVQCAQRVLIADPNDPMLTNNLVVALVYRGSLKEAAELCERLASTAATGDAGCTSVATRGLVRFRAGEIEAGRTYYQRAFDNAPRRLKMLVLAHWLKEEARVSPLSTLPTLERLQRIAVKHKDKVSQRVIEIALEDAMMLAQACSDTAQRGNSPATIEYSIAGLESDQSSMDGSPKRLV